MGYELIFFLNFLCYFVWLASKRLSSKIIFFCVILESSHRRNIAIGNTTLVLDMKDTAGEVSPVLHEIWLY